MKRKSRAMFTLIEMLVVISIISILASFLMPALRSSIESSKGVSCTNNLRQISLAEWMYIESNNNRTVASVYPTPGYGTSWDRTLLQYGYFNSPEKALVCPSDEVAPAAGKYKRSYGITSNPWDALDDQWASNNRIVQIKRPDITTIHFDATALSSSCIQGSAYYYGGINDKAVGFRHNDSGNYLFVSGVVRTLQSIPLLSSNVFDAYYNGGGSGQYGGIWKLSVIGQGAALDRF